MAVLFFSTKGAGITIGIGIGICIGGFAISLPSAHIRCYDFKLRYCCSLNNFPSNGVNFIKF